MSNPWDIPPIPWHGDVLPTKTHEARSRALDAWEHLEISLYILDGWIGNVLKERGIYGSGIIFVKRLENLETASGKFFVKYPSQHNESEYEILMCHIRQFSQRRHDIAHGIVQPLITLKNKDLSQTEWALMPPFYNTQRIKIPKYFPNYAYTEQVLLEFVAKFEALREQLIRFSELIFLLSQHSGKYLRSDRCSRIIPNTLAILLQGVQEHVAPSTAHLSRCLSVEVRLCQLIGTILCHA
jgi:hypothetical protein